MDKINLILADDQILFVESLKRVIGHLENSIHVVAVAHDGKEAISLVEKYKPHIVLMDVRMPKMDGVEATKIIHSKHPKIHIIMLTTFDDDEYVKEALRHGAVGYILKDIPPQELVSSIKAINDGSFLISPSIANKLINQAFLSKERLPHNKLAVDNAPEWYTSLSNREKEVLGYIAKGLNNKEIADLMCVAEQTIKNHVSMIYSKVGCNERIRLMEKTRTLFSGR